MIIKVESQLSSLCSLLSELSNMSFEDILKLQNKVGTKVYNKVAYGGDKSQKSCKKKKRLNKNRWASDGQVTARGRLYDVSNSDSSASGFWWQNETIARKQRRSRDLEGQTAALPQRLTECVFVFSGRWRFQPRDRLRSSVRSSPSGSRWVKKTCRRQRVCSSLLLRTLELILFLCVVFAQMFRDPRFDDLSGEYKPEIFEKTFKFINDIKHREKEVRGVQMGLIWGAALL